MATVSSKELTIARVFDAPRARVWNAWTDPEHLKRWWGPKDFTSPVCKIDLRVGGKFVYCMRGAGMDGVVRDFWNTGRHQEIVPMEKIVMTMSFADEEGRPVPASRYGLPGKWPSEVLITVTFEDVAGGKTRVVVREVGIPAEMSKFAGLGWEQSFDKLADSLK